MQENFDSFTLTVKKGTSTSEQARLNVAARRLLETIEMRRPDGTVERVSVFADESGRLIDVQCNGDQGHDLLEFLDSFANLFEDSEPIRYMIDDDPGFAFFRIKDGRVQKVGANIVPAAYWYEINYGD